MAFNKMSWLGMFPTILLISIFMNGNAVSVKAPLPGGCNMEFSVETAPYLQLRLSRSLITVDAQLASLPSLSLACDDYSSLIHLEIYHMYLPERDFTPESYYDAIRKMSTVDSIRSNGKLVAAPERGSTLRRTFSAYPGTGSVYGVIAVSGYSASAYVPAFTYACGSKYIPDEDMCEILTAPFSKLLCAMIFFCGLLMCFFGHRFFKTEMFLLGFIAAANVAYMIIASYNPDFNEPTLDVFSFFSGLGFGLLWLGFWLCFGIPILTVLLATLTLGYILASVAMFAGLGDYALLQWDINYWTAFICIMISICVIFSPLMHKANILCCAILGAFAIVAPIDHYIGSNLKFIVVNTMRRATVPEFSSAIIDPPFQWKDCLLSVSWILMSIIGVGAQCWLQRGKPPFPPPPYQPRDESFTTTRRRGLSLVRGEDATERTPLVTDARILYGASSDSVFSSPATHNDVGTSGSRIGRLLTVLKIYHRDPVDSNK
ncbi:transmembrane 7 superfamily member 3 isoform X3 [Anabrus simplex]|uniref:transmembrane 7 superfamily member 3 isoform X3 n=1 Tax=Anabrus simplex TaxID=316456 RepID=UPI0034DD7677